jgi:predicted Zn-dependent protease
MEFTSSPEIARRIETHLKRALELDPQDREARSLLGRLYVGLGRWDDARNYLKDGVSEDPTLALALAAAEAGRGDESAARSWAERAAKFYASKLDQAANDDPEARIGQAKATALLGQHERAVQLLQAGEKKNPHPAYGPALAQICADWVRRLEQGKPGAIAERLRAVQLGLAAAPADLYLVEALGRLTSAQGDAAEAARKVVTELLAQGTNAPVLHFSLGTMAAQAGDHERARTHFEAAYAGAPELPNIGNNLATVLLDGPNPDPARALEIIQPLATKFPQNPYYRDTRGHALLALGKPREAMLDLEFALPLLPDKAPVHRALAEVYRQLDMPELAAEHTRLAASTTPAVQGVLKNP